MSVMACFWSLVGEATARPRWPISRAARCLRRWLRRDAGPKFNAGREGEFRARCAGRDYVGGAGVIPACAGRRRFGLLREPLLGRRWTPMVQCGSRAEENLSVDARESPLQPLPTRDQSSFYRPQGRLMRAYQTYIHVPVAAFNACVVTRPPRGIRTSPLAICSLILTSRRVERCLYR
jgi:hypothetical protein